MRLKQVVAFAGISVLFLLPNLAAAQATSSTVQAELTSLLQELIHVFTAELNLLIQQHGAANTQSPPAAPASSTCTITDTLTIGASGTAVTCLQQYLIANGFSIPAGATGYFGTQTQSAVAAWQDTHNQASFAVLAQTIDSSTASTSVSTGIGGSSIAVIGDPQVVYDYSTQHCDNLDIPDSPARAFRDAQGNVSLIASADTTRRAVGSSLYSVQHQCAVIATSHNDPVFRDFRYHQWTTSPYTIDGNTVYAIMHNEWYGHLTDSACSPTDGINDWVSALTLDISIDGGATFTQPADYIVNYPPTPWSNSFTCTKTNPTRYGDLGQSNIITKDGYYYMLYRFSSAPGQKLNTCLMRTSDLSSADSWQVWMGTSTGYVTSKTATCAPLTNMGFIGDSLTYNSYLKEYVATGSSSKNPVRGMPAGFYYSTSPDLINWSLPHFIMSDTNGTQTFAYPSLLDPTDTTRNFEVTGQRPYLYYTTINDKATPSDPQDLNRNLMRVQIQFQ